MARRVCDVYLQNERKEGDRERQTRYACAALFEAVKKAAFEESVNFFRMRFSTLPFRAFD